MEMKKYYENPHSFSVNTAQQVPPTPYATVEDALAVHGKTARTVTPLSENWAHYTFASMEEIPGEIFNPQSPLHNFTTCSFPHTRDGKPFDFLIDPPYLPSAVGVQVFAKNLNVNRTDDGFTRLLTVEGCYNGCYGYLNGKLLGFHGQPGATLTFDCTPHLQNGANRLVLVVTALSFANYLVPSNRFGVLGKVSLISRRAGGVQNLSVSYQLPCHYKTATLTARVDALCPEEVVLSVFDPTGEQVCKAPCKADGSFEITLSSPLLWSDQTPNLYKIVAQFDNEITCYTFGLRNCTFDEKGMQVNGRRVELKGVVYQPACLEESTVEQDLLRMKAHHINTLYLQEFPKKEWLDLCDRLGLYVMAHSGVHTPYLANCNHNFVAHELAFRDLFIHRMEMLAEESAHPCVISRTVGSHCGMGSNIKFAADTLRLVDPNCPVCMGDAPKGQWETLHYDPQNEILTFDDHSLPRVGTLCGEWDRLQSILPQIRQRFCPIGVTLENAATGEILLENKNPFGFFSQYQCNYQITRYGKVVEEGMGGIFSIPPATAETVQLPYHIPGEGECVLRLLFTRLGDTPFAKDGDTVGEFWFQLPTTPRRNTAPVCAPLPELTQQENQLHVYAAGCHYTVSTQLGQLVGMEYHEQPLLLPPSHHTLEFGCRGVTYTIEENCIVITAQLKVGQAGLPPTHTLTKKFTFYGDGCVAIEPTLTPADGLVERQWHLPADLCTLHYYGFGPVNTPCDSVPGSYPGHFTAHLKEQPLQNAKGKLFRLTNEQGFGIALFHNSQPFTVSAVGQKGHLALTLTPNHPFLLKPVEQGEDIWQYYNNTYQPIS